MSKKKIPTTSSFSTLARRAMKKKITPEGILAQRVEEEINDVYDELLNTSNIDALSAEQRRVLEANAQAKDEIALILAEVSYELNNKSGFSR